MRLRRGGWYPWMRARKPIIGLCGGIGSGKSTVAAVFESLGCLVIASDALNHEVLSRAEVRDVIRGWWGESVVGADGALDRRKMAEIVFSDPRERERLESLTHPLIRQLQVDKIRQDSHSKTRAVILDSPLLFESDLHRSCDVVVFVDADHDTRLQRVSQTRGWGEDELDRREQWQKPLSWKRSRADYVIANNGARAHLETQARTILDDIVSRARSLG